MELILVDEVKKYIKELSSSGEMAQIYQYFERQQELSYRIKEPVSKRLQHNLNEIRPGPHRFLFFYHEHQMVVIHVFRKKSRRTPEGEIEAAMRKMELYLKGGG